MSTSFFDHQSDLAVDEEQVEKLLAACVSHENIECDEIALHLVDEDKIKKLHQKHFDDPSVTDCISLPIDEPGPDCEILGEIFVCPKTAISFAKAHGLDPYTECSLYIVHGFLHLIGYDDIDEDDELKMREKEKELMEHLGTLGLILTKPSC